jgi:dipeptidyl aminopeptidase/acylaminoacyl peptidase
MNKTLAIQAFAILAGCFIQFASAAEPAVETKDGNIFLRSGDGSAKQLTQSGRDSAPVISPDGRWIVFVRAVPGKTISTGSGEEQAAELWQVRADGKEPTLLVAPRAAEDMKNVIASFQDVRFSSDGRHVFFVTPAYATSGAVHAVDTTNRKQHFVMAGSGLELVPSGEYKDCLLVEQHRYFIGGGSFDWIWLFRPDGKEIGPVGESSENFKDTYCPEMKEPEKPH